MVNALERFLLSICKYGNLARNPGKKLHALGMGIIEIESVASRLVHPLGLLFGVTNIG